MGKQPQQIEANNSKALAKFKKTIIKQNGQSSCINKTNKPGRPINDQIQNLFLTIIRGPKLQLINSQSQLQLQIAFFTTSSRQRSMNQQSDDPTILSLKLRKDFQYLKQNQKTQLQQIYQKQKVKWIFNQIQSQKDLPEYFFDSGNDLSFILYRIILNQKQFLQKEIQKKNQLAKSNSKNVEIKMQNSIISNWKFKPEQILYLALMSLNQRQTLRYKVLDFLLKNVPLLISLTKMALQKVKQKYAIKLEQQKNRLIQLQKQKSRLLVSQQTSYNKDMILSQQVYDGQQQNSFKKSIPKSKPPKSTKTKNKNNEMYQESQQKQQSSTIISQQQKQQKLTFSLINYISWAFYYIYPQYQKVLKLQDQLHSSRE